MSASVYRFSNVRTPDVLSPCVSATYIHTQAKTMARMFTNVVHMTSWAPDDVKQMSPVSMMPVGHEGRQNLARHLCRAVPVSRPEWTPLVFGRPSPFMTGRAQCLRQKRIPLFLDSLPFRSFSSNTYHACAYSQQAHVVSLKLVLYS